MNLCVHCCCCCSADGDENRKRERERELCNEIKQKHWSRWYALSAHWNFFFGCLPKGFFLRIWRRAKLIKWSWNLKHDNAFMKGGKKQGDRVTVEESHDLARYERKKIRCDESPRLTSNEFHPFGNLLFSQLSTQHDEFSTFFCLSIR